MIFNDEDRKQITATVTTSVNPSTATLALMIDGLEHATTWAGAATTTAGKWTRTATTAEYFAGATVPAGDVDGAVVLTLGIHPAELVCTIGATIIATNVEAIHVRP